MRNQIQLGREPLDPRVHLKCYDREIAAIKECCDNQDTFHVLLENYNDQCFSMDMDQNINELIAYGYVATTAT